MPSQDAPILPPVAVATDHPCSTCGYNLRMLDVASRCPECGVPVGFSLNDVAFGGLPRDVLRAVSEGAWFLLAVNVFLGAMLAIARPSVAGAPVFVGGSPVIALAYALDGGVVLRLTIFAALALRSAALFVLFTPTDDAIPRTRGRVLGALPAAIVCAAFAIAAFPPEGYDTKDGLWVLGVVALACDVWTAMRLALHLSGVAERAHALRLVRMFEVGMVMQVLFVVAGTCLMAAPDTASFQFVALPPMIVGALLTTAATVALTLRLGRALRLGGD
jgi:hypothetical protein